MSHQNRATLVLIEEPASLHKYLYVHADPVNLIDPEGLSPSSEYGFLTRIIMAARASLVRLSKAIQCVFLKAASWIASAHSVLAWIAVQVRGAEPRPAPLRL